MPKVKTEIKESNNTTSSIQSENIKLRERVAFLESVLENLPHDLAVFDTMHRYLFINKKAVKNDNMRHWLINRTDFDYCERKNISSKVAEDREKIFVDVIGQKQKICFEETRGNEVISRNFIPVIEDAEVKYILGYAYDVSEIKQLEQRIISTNSDLNNALALIKEEHNKALLKARLRELIFNAKSIDLLCTQFTKACVESFKTTYAVIHLYNPAKEVYSAHFFFDETYGGNIHSAITYLNALSQTLATNKSEEKNYCAFNSDGHKGMAFAIENIDGQLEGCLMVGGLDETEVQKVELLKGKAQLIAIKTIELNAQKSIELANATLQEQVEVRTKELKIINKSLEMFSANVSHDLRGPLRQISAFSNLLQKEIEPVISDAGITYLNFINQSAKKLSGLVDALLKFSRLGSKQLNASVVNLPELLNSVVANQTLIYPNKKFEIETSVLDFIIADEVLLGQVFENLISNALKYSSTTNQPKILIKAWKLESKVFFSIEDNGLGFDSTQNGLFQPFHRFHSDEEFEGTGFGLASVASIIKKHGGTIYAESEVGKGAKFTFHITE